MDRENGEKNRLLVVEDDADINQLLCTILKKAGYAVESAFSGSEARLLLSAPEASFDLILLDLMLPGLSGAELVKELRGGAMGLRNGERELPVIVVSARTAIEDKVQLLQLGADDYVTKPFEAAEVLARVEAVLRRYRRFCEKGPSGNHSEIRLSFRDLTLDKVARRVTLGEAEINLTVREFDILALLMSQPDRVFTRENLYNEVWGSQYYGEDNTVSVHVSNIRTKLAKAMIARGEAEVEYIKTVWGIGFKMSDRGPAANGTL